MFTVRLSTLNIVPDKVNLQVHLNEGFNEVEMGEMNAGL